MSAEAGFDFNMQAMRMGLGMNKASSGGGDGTANEKDIFEYLIDSIGSQAGAMTTILTGAPNKSDLLSTGVFKSFEMPEGMHEKMINPMASSFAAPGGFLYRMLSSLMKNSGITSMADGVGEGLSMGEGGGDFGGGDYGSGGDSGGGGGGGDYSGGGADYSAGDFTPSSGQGVEPLMVDYGGLRFEASSMSESALGNISPSSGVDASHISRGDIEIG